MDYSDVDYSHGVDDVFDWSEDQDGVLIDPRAREWERQAELELAFLKIELGINPTGFFN